jgi:hypothetical protein
MSVVGEEQTSNIRGLIDKMARVLWQQHCLEVASRLHHVGVVEAPDELRITGHDYKAFQ